MEWNRWHDSPGEVAARTLQERIDRLEALDQIRQLASRYALAVDNRDMDDLAALFVEDVRVERACRVSSTVATNCATTLLVREVQ
jgi:hypothetical protein